LEIVAFTNSVTPGTPEQITTESRTARSIGIQAHPANTGRVYIGTSATMNKATHAGVIRVLAAGASFDITGIYQEVRADKLWMDADGSGDVIVGVLYVV